MSKLNRYYNYQRKMRRLRAERLARGLTQRELSEASGVSTSCISYAECYGIMPEPRLEEVAQAFGWTGDMHELLEVVGS